MRRCVLLLALASALAWSQEHAAPAAQPEHSTSHANEQATGARPTGEHSPTPEGHAKEAVEHGEGHATEAMPNEIWWKWANFALLALGLGWLMKKFAGPYFASRGRAIEQGIEEARQMKSDADARAAQIEAKLASLNTEIEALRTGAREEIAHEGARVQAETEAQLNKVQAHAESEIAAAAKTASQQLKAYAAELAVKLAEEQLRSRLSGSEQAGLVSAFIHDLDRQGGKGTLN